MEKIAVSIVVPIYNAEPYLEKCLDSIVNQTLSNIEIILIDDGSKDRSAEICKKYVEKDSRIIYYRKENEGLAAARQDGIERASGEYIGFVDSDDWLELNMYERMYQVAKEATADIVFCNCYVDDYEKYPVHLTSGVYQRDDIEKKILTRTLAGLTDKGANSVIRWSNCLRIYRLDLIKQNNIAFDRRFRRSQDLQLTFETTANAEVYASINDEYLYHNRSDNNGQSLSRGYTENYWGLIRPLIERLYQDIEQYELQNLKYNMYLCTFFFAYQGVLNECVKSKKSLKIRIDNLNKIIKDELVVNALKSINKKQLNENYQMIYKGIESCNGMKMFIIFKSYPLKSFVKNKLIKGSIRVVLNCKYIEPIYVKIRKIINKSYEPR